LNIHDIPPVIKKSNSGDMDEKQSPEFMEIGFSLLYLYYSPFSIRGIMDPIKKPGNARLVDPDQ